MLSLPDLAERGYDRADEELPALSLYGWCMANLDHEPDDWDPEKVHLSDYTYYLDAEEGGCERQLWHRFRQDESEEVTLWRKLMWDQGFAMQIRFSWLIVQGLPEDWSLHTIEADVSEGLPGRDVGSCDLILEGPDYLQAVEFKTQRGKAFQYLDEPKPSHRLQSQAELFALKRMFDQPVKHALMYLDREGQNHPLQFPTRWDDWVEERIEKASNHANEIHLWAERTEAVELDVLEMVADNEWEQEGLAGISYPEMKPPTIEPVVKVRENKSANSIYLEQPWPCDYCDYYQQSCPGALSPDLVGHGIVAKGDVDGNFTMKVDNPDLSGRIRTEVMRAVHAGNVRAK